MQSFFTGTVQWYGDRGSFLMDIALRLFFDLFSRELLQEYNISNPLSQLSNGCLSITFT